MLILKEKKAPEPVEKSDKENLPTSTNSIKKIELDNSKKGLPSFLIL